MIPVSADEGQVFTWEGLLALSLLQAGRYLCIPEGLCQAVRVSEFTGISGICRFKGDILALLRRQPLFRIGVD